MQLVQVITFIRSPSEARTWDLNSTHRLLSSSFLSRWELIRLKVIGHMFEIETSFSADIMVVAHLSAPKTGATSCISCQYSSFSSKSLASWSLVTVRSDSTAVTAQRCSNISQTEFHLVLQDCISR